MAHARRPGGLLKRALDIIGGSIALLVGGVPMLVIAALIWLRMGRPVVLRSTRPGRNERPFVCYKFRTMADLRDASGSLLPDEERLGPMGRTLRSLSLDELPQLLNVLKGDMSLVGPRPLLMEYVHRYSPEQRRRHEVKPGMTGWTQINGRNALDWNRKLELDVWYVDHRSLSLDLKILALTPWKVLRREGISASGHATMPRFDAE